MLKETLELNVRKKESQGSRTVLLLVENKELELTGLWEWDFQSETVFSSDVMLSLPAEFEGTRSIIHPDDLPIVKERVNDLSSEPVRYFQFRIITSYGSVKTLIGRNVVFTDASFLLNILSVPAEKAEGQYRLSHRMEQLAHHQQALKLAERATGIGTWWYNSSTHQVHYSDGMFYLYGLPPQSLNAHPFTFVSFVHQDERDIVIDSFTRSIKLFVPLHLQHRILRSDGKVRVLQHICSWQHNDIGALVLYGTAQDVTENLSLEHRAAEAEDALQFCQRLISFSEQTAGTAHWYMNLVTRKLFYSDTFYRLHGVKPGTILGKPAVFLNYVHPDDRDIVSEVNSKMLKQHTPPDMEYRITRSDGKIRYVRQQGKLLFLGDEMVMTCVLEDITHTKVSENKMSLLNDKFSVQEFVSRQADELAGTCSWWTDMETNVIRWSDSMYAVLGLKNSGLEIRPKHLQNLIHPEDQKLFKDSLQMAMNEKQETKFHFRLVRPGKLMHMQATFRTLVHQEKELFIATLQDVTTQYLLKQQLTDKVRVADILTENIPDCVLVTDDNNNILVWNRGCEEMLGQKRDKVLQQNFFDVFPQLKTADVLTEFNKVLKGEEVFLKGVQSLTRAGRYENISMLPIRNEEGKVSGILHLIQDITHAHQMQQRLTERLNFIENLVEASVDRIIVMDRHMNYLYCNEKAARYYGLAKEEIVGKNVLEIFPDSLNKPTFEHFRKALKGETVHVPAIEGFTDDGYYQVYLVPIKNDKGDVTAVLWMHRDLRQALKLQRQQERAAEIVNSINAAFVELDSDLNLRYINNTVEKLFNKTSEELLHKSVLEAFPGLVNTAGHQAVITANEKREKVEVEYYSETLTRWMFLSVTPFADGVLLFFYDLKERNKELHDILNAIPHYVWTSSPDGQGLFHNSYWLKQSGIDPTSDPEAWLQTIHPDDRERTNDLWQQSLASGIEYYNELRVKNVNGEYRWHISRALPLRDDKGNIRLWVGTSTDINELKQAKGRLKS